MTNWTPQAANTLALPLKVFGVSLAGSVVTLEVDAVPGRHYQVEFKDSLGETGWQPLGGLVLATGPVLSVMDNTSGNGQRFYRIRRLD